MNTVKNEDWLAPTEIRLPNFIICGAMKSGTSTVHQILNQHPRISIPDKEIHFFDSDNLLEHPDYFICQQGKWHYPDIRKHRADMWQRYEDFFNASSDSSSIIGEDSTCYLASKHAPMRIAIQEKPIKIVICLRHPTHRCYSHYWHYVRSGRAMFDFNDTIRLTPYDIIQRSLYLPQIENFLRHIPRERIFFITFEEFLKNKKQTIDNLLVFLGVPVNELPTTAYETHANKARLPKSIKLQLFTNRMFRNVVSNRYQNHWPNSSWDEKNKRNRWIQKFRNFANAQKEASPPPIPEDTKHFLDDYFKKELVGLDELIGSNTTQHWFT